MKVFIEVYIDNWSVFVIVYFTKLSRLSLMLWPWLVRFEYICAIFFLPLPVARVEPPTLGLWAVFYHCATQPLKSFRLRNVNFISTLSQKITLFGAMTLSMTTFSMTTFSWTTLSITIQNTAQSLISRNWVFRKILTKVQLNTDLFSDVP